MLKQFLTGQKQVSSAFSFSAFFKFPDVDSSAKEKAISLFTPKLDIQYKKYGNHKCNSKIIEWFYSTGETISNC